MKFNEKFGLVTILMIFINLIFLIQATNVESHTNVQVESRNKVESKNKVEAKLKTNSESKGKRTATEFFTELFSENVNLGNFLGGAKHPTSITNQPSSNNNSNRITSSSTTPGSSSSDSGTSSNTSSSGSSKSSSTSSNTAQIKSDSNSSAGSSTNDILNLNNNLLQNTKTNTNTNSNSNSDNNSILSDWLSISSPAFTNSKQFPAVTLPNGNRVVIKADSSFFRINDGYKSSDSKDDNIPPSKKYFWFRLSGTHLYYSSTTTDINILGAISVKFISTVEHVELKKDEGEACFDVKDTEDQEWKICAASKEVRTKWVCKLQQALGITEDFVCTQNSKNNEKTDIIENKTIIQPLIIIPLPSPHCNEDWNYQQNGRNWNCDCSEGKEQSPIDLPLKEKAIDSPIKPMFQYDELSIKSPTTLNDGQVTESENLKLRFDQNTLKITHDKMGKVVTLDGAVYYAQEIIIHTPAEHKINGKKYDMEIQIIHYGQTKGDIAKQVILSFLFEKKAGIYNKFIDDLDIFNLPNPLTKQIDLTHNLFIPKILYSSDEDEVTTMKPFSFYTYQGSITFPPCTEKTIVYVASKPLPIGTTALQLFQEAIRIPDLIDHKGNVIVSDWIPMSNREIQPINGRPIFHFDHEKYCGPDPVKKPKPEPGHYEKIMKSLTKYFYVSDSRPSGLPGAFVVSEREANGQAITQLR